MASLFIIISLPLGGPALLIHVGQFLCLARLFLSAAEEASPGYPLSSRRSERPLRGAGLIGDEEGASEGSLSGVCERSLHHTQPRTQGRGRRESASWLRKTTAFQHHNPSLLHPPPAPSPSVTGLQFVMNLKSPSLTASPLKGPQPSIQVTPHTTRRPPHHP